MIENLFRGEHLLLILLVVVLLFPSKVGSLGGSLGRSIRDFKKALNEDPSAPAAASGEAPTVPGTATTSAGVAAATPSHLQQSLPEKKA